jgi:hypothetical protein
MLTSQSVKDDATEPQRRVGINTHALDIARVTDATALRFCVEDYVRLVVIGNSNLG